MDDFRVGSVPTSDPYGHHQPHASIARKREKHHNGEAGQEQDDPADSFEPELASDGHAEIEDETIEDYYLPSDPSADAE
jgi:hypothetical protein